MGERTTAGILGDVTKDRNLNVRLAAEDLERLERLAAHYALSASSVVRMLVKQAADALPVPATTKTKPTK